MPAPVESRRFRPVVAWATLGLVFLTIEIVALTGWFTSGDFKRTPPGPTPVPSYIEVGSHVMEAIGVVALPIFLYYFLIRPWRRERHITTDGLFCLAFFTVFWQDSLPNYFQPWLTYNAVLFNRGAWDPHILGWLSPNGNLMAEPLIWVLPVYVYCCFGIVLISCWLTRKVRARWPQLGTAGLLALWFCAFFVVDLIVEPPWLAVGLYAYPGAIEWLTLFHGHYYQFPIYEAVMVGLWWTVMTSLRYFKNDKDETIAERGIDRVRVTGRAKTVVRFLALVGAVNIGQLSYNIPAALFGLYASPWPKDITDRSYLTNGLCGPNAEDYTGVKNACSGPAVPIPRRDSARLGPDGTLVVPAGTELPTR
jgi:hypothetical protein